MEGAFTAAVFLPCQSLLAPDQRVTFSPPAALPAGAAPTAPPPRNHPPPLPLPSLQMLPLLLSALEFGGAPAHAVGSLMVIGNNLEGEEFTKRVVPTLTKLFASQGKAKHPREPL